MKQVSRYCRRVCAGGVLGAAAALAQTPVEPRLHLVPQADAPPRLALTLDACSGGWDATLLDFLVRERIAATLFVTARWIRRNPAAVAQIKSHPDLFQVENHGARHVPAIIGAGRSVYGLAGMADLAELQAEVQGGAQAIVVAFGVQPRWYRGAAAVYDREALQLIANLGYRVAGYSLNADAGATLPPAAVAQRLSRARDGDVIIAHFNKPHSGTAAGLMQALLTLRQRGFVFVRLDQAEARAAPVPAAFEVSR